jgi:putative transposase
MHKDLREIWLAPDLATAGVFDEKYAPKYDKAVECLIKRKTADVLRLSH